MNRKKIFRWLKVIIIVYCIIGIALYYLQEKFLFHPVALDKNYSYQFNMPFKEITLDLDANTQYNMVVFLPKNDSVVKGAVLYFHGNKENINRYAKFANNFTKNGYEVWMVDYPTFGKTNGKLTEENLYSQALEVYKMANAKFGKDSIIIYGKSLGTGIATQLASIRNCKRIILETPYYSMTSLAQRYCFIYPVKPMLKYKLPSNAYIKKITDPISIFQGTNDGVVPYSNAYKLNNLLKKNDEFITIEKGTHNNLNDFTLYHTKLDSLLK